MSRTTTSRTTTPRETIPLSVPDLSAFAKALRSDLAAVPETPGHLALLGMLARAAGYRNYQHLRAKSEPAPAADLAAVDRAARVFDADGRMTRWPGRTALQGLCLWVFWSRLPARTDLSERAVNEVLKTGATFGDHVLLRRSLIDHRLVERSRDGAIYRRIEQAPPPEARELIRRFQRPE